MASFIDGIGLERVIDAIGLKRVIAHVGADELVAGPAPRIEATLEMSDRIHPW